MKCRKLVRLLCLGLVVFFIGSTSASALTVQEKLKYTRYLIGFVSDPTPLEKAKYAGFTGSASKLTPQEKEKYAKAFLESASGLTTQERARYAKFLMGSFSELTPQEREKYSDVFLESALMLTPQEKASYANLPGVQHLKKIKPNGDYTYRVKMATLAPDGVGWVAVIKDVINPGIIKVTSGLITLDWYYGGTMGDDQDILAKMRNGQVQGGAFSGQGIVLACPEMALMELPFLFENYDEVEYVYSKLRPRISQWYEKRGYHLIVLAEQDFDQLYSTKMEIKTPEDFKKSRFLTWYGPLEERSLKALGASPLPIRVPEVAASIRTGVCDAFISPALWAVGTQMYTIMKYINPLHIRYSPAGGVITNQTWNLMPKEAQIAIDYFVISAEKEFRQKVRAGNEKCVKSMIKYGMKEVKMTPAEIDVFRKRLLPVWDEFAEKGYYSKAELAEVKALLAEYRARNKK
jgi:TRAP-type C4-dicarboxylate transport system substrate-binding protein